MQRPNVKAQMEYIWTKFDDGTGVIRAPQQNTYDTAMRSVLLVRVLCPCYERGPLQE